MIAASVEAALAEAKAASARKLTVSSKGSKSSKRSFSRRPVHFDISTDSDSDTKKSSDQHSHRRSDHNPDDSSDDDGEGGGGGDGGGSNSSAEATIASYPRRRVK